VIPSFVIDVSLGDTMYRELREKVGRTGTKLKEAKAQGKVTPEIQKLAQESRAASRARNPVEFEKKTDKLLDKLK